MLVHNAKLQKEAKKIHPEMRMEDGGFNFSG
jgi:hypothetical protein